MGKKKPTPKAVTPSVTAGLDAIHAKFARLKELQTKAADLRATIYPEISALTRELLPLFITHDKDAFLISRDVVIGTKRYRFTPGFYSEKDGIKEKAWKSTPFEIGTIEIIG